MPKGLRLELTWDRAGEYRQLSLSAPPLFSWVVFRTTLFGSVIVTVTLSVL
jgi:hypothetical protein